ncbi:D-3-phosphoglycerate dehydrogenase [Bacillus sp. SA1-12]|uniref:phosphoglycerate dehydrogenase n=1 Tax=Bacillus sp. SA1-12 TaxID=1455638 RepID=UPI0006266827|nr:phosphoglycerate dehydrogenase [Bacillus sp. SA1-12]KKI93117.1 D-3-phosphoglycerate dehydrogenase [Bacillus sp. SA1-12]
MIHILVSDSISSEGLQPLLEASHIHVVQKKVDEVTKDLHLFDALLVRSATKVTAELLKEMTNLKIVGRAGVGVDNIDVNAATKHGVVVINAPNGNTISTTEHTFAMMASLVRHIPQANMTVKSNKWNRHSFVGTELFGKSLGIIGFGRIGGELAKRVRVFGMNVLVYDPFLTKERAEKIGVRNCEFNELLANADIITVHTPLIKETRGILNKETIAKTKKGVYLLNCARGGIIDEAGLIYHLETGHVAGAALDVFEVEPPLNNKLLEFHNVIVTPHLGASTKEAQLNVAAQVTQEVLNYLDSKPVTSSINLPTLTKELFDKIQPFFHLAKKMGNIVSQCMKVPVQEISIQYEGPVAEIETSFITKALLAGFLDARVDISVNEVNAGMIAKERGITFSEKISSSKSGYENLIEVKVFSDKQTFVLKGTHVPHYGERIVGINDFKIDFYPTGHLLYIQHQDKPGVIGRVGKVLGDHEINIAAMQVGRKEKGGEAIMMLAFDRALDDGLTGKIAAFDDIVSIKTIDL